MTEGLLDWEDEGRAGEGGRGGEGKGGRNFTRAKTVHLAEGENQSYRHSNGYGYSRLADWWEGPIKRSIRDGLVYKRSATPFYIHTSPPSLCKWIASQ